MLDSNTDASEWRNPMAGAWPLIVEGDYFPYPPYAPHGPRTLKFIVHGTFAPDRRSPRKRRPWVEIVFMWRWWRSRTRNEWMVLRWAPGVHWKLRWQSWKHHR